MIRYGGIEGSVSILRKIDARAFEMYFFIVYNGGECIHVSTLIF